MKWLPLVAALCGMAASTLQQTLLASAAPTIVAEFGAPRIYPWIAGCYLLSSAVTLPWAGTVTDRLGPRPIYLAGSATFIIGTLGTSLSAGPALFLAARAVQGVGAGLLVPAALIIVSNLHSNRDRGRAYGLVGLIQMVANVTGPPLGGWFTDGIGWRWGVAASTPFALAGLLLACRTMTTRATSPRWWKVSPVQLVDVHASTTVRRLLTTTLFIGGLAVSVTTYLPWALIYRHGFTATHSGWFLVPTLLSSALGSLVGGTLAHRPFALRATAGSLLLAFPFALMNSAPMLAAAGAVVGLCCGAALPIILTLVQDSSAKDKFALNTSWIQLSRHIGAAVTVPSVGLWTASDAAAHAAAGILASLAAVACCATAAAFCVPLTHTRPRP